MRQYSLLRRDDAIPWPFTPNEQHVVGNSYGAYQGFDPDYPYMHPGIDILVPFGEPVYAVRSGVVKAVRTTAADLHWRVAVGDEDTSALSPGYLYAHLVESSITVSVGDHVEIGQHLGNIVEWVTDFHHLHFARIESSGTTWSGGWRNTLNPHLAAGKPHLNRRRRSFSMPARGACSRFAKTRAVIIWNPTRCRAGSILSHAYLTGF